MLGHQHSEASQKDEQSRANTSEKVHLLSREGREVGKLLRQPLERESLEAHMANTSRDLAIQDPEHSQVVQISHSRCT